MLATSTPTSPRPGGSSASLLPSVQYSASRSRTPFSSALVPADVTERGSISTPTARSAPISSAPMASTPDPVPKSMTYLPATPLVLSQPRHRRVVGCSPVPNASPGSRTTLSASGSSAGASHQAGTIHSPSMTLVGVKLSNTTLTQSLPGIVSATYSTVACRISSASAMMPGMSESGANITVMLHEPHTLLSPAYSSCSASVPRSASSTLQHVAPSESNTSDRAPRSAPRSAVIRMQSTELPSPAAALA
mmetsp:Transcript_13655/g.22347  ORF Transcript_13655/g.22347 Transcript_13655/m.22347 type:complete len:249 (-) Transcript_13655:531-1277(-)